MPVFYGEYNDDGSIKTDVIVCALTGTIIEPGDATFDIAGTKHFVRVKASAAQHINGRLAPMWQQVLDGAPKPAAPEMPVEAFDEAPAKKAKA